MTNLFLMQSELWDITKIYLNIYNFHKFVYNIKGYKKRIEMRVNMDFKSYIAEAISKVTNINQEEIKSFIEIPKDEANGDFAFPCFRLAKELKQSPINIANNIKENIVVDKDIIDKIDVVSGYLNFYVSKTNLVNAVISKFDSQKEDYGKSNIGEGKTVIVEYSSPNIAKPFHIGHLKTTIIYSLLLWVSTSPE